MDGVQDVLARSVVVQSDSHRQERAEAWSFSAFGPHWQ